ncbi:MAG: MaoC/PaaZ C-terminal domain-containing protein [Candidatus Caldarchaeum sp.]
MGLKNSLNRDYVGKEYDAVVYKVTEEAVQNYAKAYGDHNYWYYCGAMAPPIFPVVYELPILEKAWSDEGLHGGTEEARRNILMLVHGEQMMRFYAPIRPGDTITARAKIVSIEDKGSGEVINFSVTSTNQRDERVTESNWSLFIRGIGSGKKTKSAAAQSDGVALGELQLAFRNVIRVSEGITYSYAEASGDRNPIHIDEKVAKAAGLRGIIVHGLCTMAMTMKGLIESYCAGNPAALSCMGVRFSSPVYPGDTLIADGWEMGVKDGKIILGFEVTRKSDGVKVLKGGYAEVAL